jgi:uncharacterized protein (TIGR04255 family)
MNRDRTFEIDLTETFRHLAAAPIAEAVIHWQARASASIFNPELAQILKSRLPDYPNCRPQHKLELEAEFAAEGTASQCARDSLDGFRLTRADQSHIVQFKRDGIVFSRLPPYESWKVFLDEGWRIWRLFVELAEPTEVQRLGVRFINRIPVRQLTEVPEWLSCPPDCLEAIGLPTSGFLYESRHTVPGYPFHVNVVRTIQVPSPSRSEEFGLIVDIDVGTSHSLPCQDDIVRNSLEQMHWLKNRVFFSLLTQDTISRFERGTT